MMLVAECPCCKGERVLWIYSAEHPDEAPVSEMCCHCEGTGEIVTELTVLCEHGIDVSRWHCPSCALLGYQQSL
jgi:DnaJ-class molecular chaperone